MGQDDDYHNGNDLDEIGTDENIDGQENTAGRRPVLLKAVALITLLAFICLVTAASLPLSRKALLAGLITESVDLKKDLDNDLLHAVVQVQVIARKNGSSIAVEQKNGTGFNISPQGLIVTNRHVVEGALNVIVEFPDGRVFKAVKWSSRSEYDLALISLESSGLPVVCLDERGAPKPGDEIMVIGNPLSLNNIVVEGIVKEYWTVGKTGQVFTIDAPIYPGNSGSPVCDRNGRVVGVVFGTMRHADNGIEKVDGLAIPIIELLTPTG